VLHFVPPVVAHVAGMRPPGIWSWIAAVVLFGGIGGAIALRPPFRWILATIALLGLVATGADMAMRSQRPTRPDLQVRLISPSGRTGNPFVVRLCGRRADGHPETPTASGRFMLVLLDGVQVGEARQSTALVRTRSGTHHLTVEVTSRDHQSFRPPITVHRLIRVRDTGTPGSILPCPT
jgi:hypothetical protein